MIETSAEYTATGTPGTRGKCPVCGTTLYRMGATPAHEGLPTPEVTARAPRKSSKKNGKQNGHQSDGPRAGKLVIVESPTKARTVGRFLGKGYTVKASVGHVRDLLRSTLSVDVEHDFTPKYRVPNEKKEVVKELASLANRAEQIYLATDPDREGEAIAWHLSKLPGSIEREHTAWCSTRSRRTRSAKRSRSRATSTCSWSTRSRRAAFSIAWWATNSVRCCGAKFADA
jgi:DNA topoisomerase-1